LGLSGGDAWLGPDILTLNRTTWQCTRRDVREVYVGIQGAEEWNARPDKDRNARDDETLYEAGTQKLLNRPAAIDVDVLETTSRELRKNVARLAGDAFNDRAGRGREQRSAAEYEDGLGAVGPSGKRQDDIVRVAAEEYSVDGGEEVVVTVGSSRAATVSGEKVEGASWPGNEAVEAGADEYGCFHGRLRAG
jgi:hypothetical protein